MKAAMIALLVPAFLTLGTGTAAAQFAGRGLSQADTTQHFQLNRDGGVIDIAASNPEDPMTPDTIRTGLAFVTMTGLPELQPLRPEITYTFEATAEGGRLFIKTPVPTALNAVHQYLRTQIRERATGDSEAIN